MGAIRNILIFSMCMTILVNFVERLDSPTLIPSKSNALIVRPAEINFTRPQVAKCPTRSAPLCRLVPSTKIVCDYYT